MADKTWGSKDMKSIIMKLSNNNVSEKAHAACNALINAVEGVLVSLGEIADDYLCDKQTQFKSLLISIKTRASKFEILANPHEALCCKNLLKREFCSFFEKLT